MGPEYNSFSTVGQENPWNVTPHASFDGSIYPNLYAANANTLPPQVNVKALTLDQPSVQTTTWSLAIKLILEAVKDGTPVLQLNELSVMEISQVQLKALSTTKKGLTGQVISEVFSEVAKIMNYVALGFFIGGVVTSPLVYTPLAVIPVTLILASLMSKVVSVVYYGIAKLADYLSTSKGKDLNAEDFQVINDFNNLVEFCRAVNIDELYQSMRNAKRAVQLAQTNQPNHAWNEASVEQFTTIYKKVKSCRTYIQAYKDLPGNYILRTVKL